MKLTRLTLNEVLSISISVVALLTAVITPFISYRWLQNSVREQRLKADGFKAAGSYTTSYNADDPKASYITYRFYISNDGPLSVGKVAISIYNGGKLFPENVAGDFKVFRRTESQLLRCEIQYLSALMNHSHQDRNSK